MTTALLDRPKLNQLVEVEVDDAPTIDSLLKVLPDLPIEDGEESQSKSGWLPDYVAEMAAEKVAEGWTFPDSLEEFLSQLGLPNGETCEGCGRLVLIGEWPICHGDSNNHEKVRVKNARAASIVYYEGRNGELRFGDYREMGIEPRRFQRHEIRSMSDAREFERRVNQKEYDKYDRSQVREQMTFEPAMKEHSSEARRVIKTEQGKEMQRQAQKLVAEKSKKPTVTKKDIGFQTAYSR